MVFMVIGVLGVAIAGLIARSLYSYALAARRLKLGQPFGGAVPGWVSLIFLISLACIVYGLVKTIF